MRLKTFSAASMAEAMQMVRDELGTEAIILSTERRAAGGGVTVTAVIEPAAPADPADAAHAVAAIGAIDAIGAALTRHGVPPMTAHRLLDAAADSLTDSPVDALAAALEAQLGFAPLFPDDDARRPLMLVGPPGAGKSVTLAKLAARARLAGETVAIVSTDTARAGAVEQLATFARLLQVPFLRAKTTAALGKAVATHAENGLVLIDTLAANPFDGDDTAMLRTLAAAADAEMLVVLPAGGDAAECAEHAEAFAGIGAELLFGARIDVARRLGGLIAAAEAGPLAFAGFGLSPQIGNGARAADATFLAQLIMLQRASARAEEAAA
jgi:flagellar biosynthesis protein FlhF